MENGEDVQAERIADMNDIELLQPFIEHGSETAFRTLVERHLPLVFGTARRITSDRALAEDVAQTVFILLARKASQLKHPTVLAGWLYRTTQFVAARSLLAEQRRRRREQESLAMQLPPDPDPLWQGVAPQLDAALTRLSESDRIALLLRYFEQQSLRQIALSLGIGEEAAKKRVGRALEKLRRVLSRRGIEISVAALGIGLARVGAEAATDLPLFQKLVTLAMADRAAGTTAIPAGSALLVDVLTAWCLARMKTALLTVGLTICGIALLTMGLPRILSVMKGDPRTQRVRLATAPPTQGPPNSKRPRSANGLTVLSTDEAAASHALHLTVLDQASGNPIPGVEVIYQLSVMNEGQPVPLHTDSAGMVTIEIPDAPTGGAERLDQFGVWLTAKNYASRTVNWLSTTGYVLRIVSPECTVRLEPGVRLSGKVVDDSDQPLSGVRVGVIGNSFRGYIIGRPEVREEDFPSIGIAADGASSNPILTDDEGQFVVEHFPSDLRAAIFELVAKDGARRRFRTPGATRLTVDQLAEVSLDELRAGTAKLVLPRGVTVEGIVVDPTDKPVAGAVVAEAVQPGNMTILSRHPTDAEGRFRLANRAQREILLTASAEGYATASRTIFVRPGIEPVRIQLTQEQLLRGRVLNQAHQPVVGANLRVIDYLIQGQGYEWTGTSDADGQFVCRGAPTNEIALSISAAGYAPQIARVRPSAEECVITLRPQGTDTVLVTGAITDSDTGAPLDHFRLKICHESTSGVPDRPDKVVDGFMGQFELTLSKKEVQVGMAPMWALLIEADGYETAFTRAYDYDEGDQELQIALHPGGLVEGVVLTPDGAPAAGAQIAFALEGDAVYAGAPGKLMHHYVVAETDEQGHWKVAKPLKARALVIFHDSGWSTSALQAGPYRIRLSPWARVEGMAMKGAAPLADEQISLGDLAWDWSVDLYIGYETQTDAEGHFVFEKVPAGEYIASVQNRGWQVNGQPNVKALQTPVTVQAGETASVRLASLGTSISAQLKIGLTPDIVIWTDALAVLTRDVPVPPEPARDHYLSNASHMAARARYVRDPSVLAALRAVKSYVGQIDATGHLRFDDIPPGRYRIEVSLFHNWHGRSAPGSDDPRLQARLRLPLTVPDPDGTTAPPIDLGELSLEIL